MAFQIDFFDYVYMPYFYEKVVPQLNTYLHSCKGDELVFNFSSLKFLSPNVVPNILCIADNYKNRFNGKKITLDLSWDPDLLSYLDTIGFFKYSNDLSLFSYDKEILGGFDTYSTKKNYRMIFSEKNSSVDEIKKNVGSLMQTMKKFNILLNKDHKDYNGIDIILEDILFHLIHNSNDKERGDSNSYGLFQINEYQKRKVAYITVCDWGNGIASTIWGKIKNKMAYPLFVKKESDPTYNFNLEALFWRKMHIPFPYKHGIYNVAKYVLERGGKIGIHSYDTYVLFTNKFYNTFLELTHVIDQIKKDNPSSEPMYSVDLLNHDLQDSLKNYSIQYSKTRKYKGVHIDIELPLGGRNDFFSNQWR
jgi:hypothetical protein